jgi:2-dehydro-3-deoxyphosphogalactonate aldolase
MREKLLNNLLAHKVIVILRGICTHEAVEAGDILFENGARFLEIPLNTPDALASIRLLSEHFKNSEVSIGAGTVLTEKDVDAVADAGGEYIISPNTDIDVIRRTREIELISIPGFATPTEAFTAIRAGADILKCFPCETPEKIAVLKSVISLPIFAVGGITAENMDSYLKVSDGVGCGIGVYRSGMSMEALKFSANSFFSQL